jgi:hypothetical protein
MTPEDPEWENRVRKLRIKKALNSLRISAFDFT